ncbi:hypothetical protein [Zhongshania sp.]|uniref:hypothetical protein n=1 Tax=Zhongshania sp. TaxID=1971902 RepID=UPI003562E9EB
MASWIVAGFIVVAFCLLWIIIDEHVWRIKEEQTGYRWAKDKIESGISPSAIRQVANRFESIDRRNGALDYLDEL